MPKRKESSTSLSNAKTRRLGKWTPETPLTAFKPTIPSETRTWGFYKTRTDVPGQLKKSEFIKSNLFAVFKKGRIEQDARNHVLCEALRRSVLFRMTHRIPIQVITNLGGNCRRMSEFVLVSSMDRRGAIIDEQWAYLTRRINWGSRPLLDCLESENPMIEVRLGPITNVALLNPRLSRRVLSLPLPVDIKVIVFTYLEERRGLDVGDWTRLTENTLGPPLF